MPETKITNDPDEVRRGTIELIEIYRKSKDSKKRRCWRCNFQWLESGGKKPLDYPSEYVGKCICGAYLSKPMDFD